MICPHCRKDIPDNSVGCPKCGKILRTTETKARDFQFKIKKGSHFSGKKAIYALLALAVIVILWLILANHEGAGEKSINESTAGESVDVESFLLKGKMNIVDFYSRYCAPCRKISPMLQKLDKKREDIVVIKVDINRPGIKRIDWESPLARQYKIKSIPYFMIYNQQGKLMHQGMDAFAVVTQLFAYEDIK